MIRFLKLTDRAGLVNLLRLVNSFLFSRYVQIPMEWLFPQFRGPRLLQVLLDFSNFFFFTCTTCI